MYRARDIKTNELVYGYYVVDHLENEDSGKIHYIIPVSKHLELYRPLCWHKVHPSSLARATGKLAQGKMIYGSFEVEGKMSDDCLIKSIVATERILRVFWDYDKCCWMTNYLGSTLFDMLGHWRTEKFEIIKE